MSVVRGSNQLLRPLFLLSFSSFLKLKFPNTLSIKVADNKIRATCVWCQKSLLCQLCYYLCPSLQTHLTYYRIHGMCKFLMTTFLSNVAKIISNFWSYFEKPHSCEKTFMATSLVTYGNIWTIFTPTFGHTAHMPALLVCLETTYFQFIYLRTES